MRKLALLLPVISMLWLAASFADAACIPRGSAPQGHRDPLARLLEAQAQCPSTALEFRNLVERAGLRLDTTEVNFQGFHNPDPGILFLFEIVSGRLPGPNIAIERGDLVFGYFLTADGPRLVLDTANSLMVEAIAWDPAKQLFNFYELVNEGGPEWFYRGDSKLVLEDIQFLYRPQLGQSPFRNQLRCSGCHVNGGLIQKELAPPYNDWFRTARQLPLGGLKPDATVSKIFQGRVDAEELAKIVTTSSRRLADSPEYRKVLRSRSMQEQLRPRFCPVELNIESDTAAFDEQKPTVQIPSAFFADPRLGTSNIAIRRTNYDQALAQFRSTIDASTRRADADHAWLTPVKANSDMLLTAALVDAGVIDNEFMADVLAVDFTNPFFSPARCGLLKLVPDEGGPTFLAGFQAALKASSDAAAKALLANLTDPKRTAEFHRQQVKVFLDACAKRATTPAATNEWFGLLAQRRAEIMKLEISKHKRGNILEIPGRVVFPSASVPSRQVEMGIACEVRPR